MSTLGCFDTIILEEEICPHCKYYSKLEFQTKAFDRGLRELSVPFNLDEYGVTMFQHVNAVLTNVIGHCNRCRTTLYADFLIIDSYVISAIVIRTEDEHYSSPLVDYITYFINFQPRLGDVDCNLDAYDILDDIEE